MTHPQQLIKCIFCKLNDLISQKKRIGCKDVRRKGDFLKVRASIKDSFGIVQNERVYDPKAFVRFAQKLDEEARVNHTSDCFPKLIFKAD